MLKKKQRHILAQITGASETAHTALSLYNKLHAG